MNKNHIETNNQVINKFDLNICKQLEQKAEEEISNSFNLAINSMVRLEINFVVNYIINLKLKLRENLKKTNNGINKIRSYLMFYNIIFSQNDKLIGFIVDEEGLPKPYETEDEAEQSKVGHVASAYIETIEIDH
jgi:hypothetical protein